MHIFCGDGKRPQLEQASDVGGKPIQNDGVGETAIQPSRKHRSLLNLNTVLQLDGDGLKQAPTQLRAADPGSKKKSK